MRSFALCLIAISCFFSGGMVTVAPANTPAGEPNELEQARSLFEEGRILHARMSHEFYDSYTGETDWTEGKIWIAKDRYRVSVEHQSVLVDGEISRVYNSVQNKLVISEYHPGEDDFAPSRFFSESEEIYLVEESFQDGDSMVFVLRSDDPFEIFTEVKIRLDEELRPLEIEALDQMDNRIRTVFSEARYIDPEEDVFRLDYPDDVEIIDLRK
ncbi:outer membrane lipoprotein carrier protein LolA [Balneolales bacterium ANBcel1]|nr:outer membrane lipoprotein carrier protein LolA [Balneolales bacterium ANBcel1]